MNGISGKQLIAERQQRALLSIHTDENIVINNIIGADGSVTDDDENIYIEVHFDIKSGYRFDPHVITNTGVFVWDSLNGRFVGRKPEGKLEITVTSIKQVVRHMKGKIFRISFYGEVYTTTTNEIGLMVPLEAGERLPNNLDDKYVELLSSGDYCLNPATGEILLYNIALPNKLSKPIVSFDGAVLTFTPGEDWDSVERILLYSGQHNIWDWKIDELVNNTVNLDELPSRIIPNGTHELTVVYAQYSCTAQCLDDGPNSDIFEYTVNRTKLSTPAVSIDETVVTFTPGADWEHVERVNISVDGEHTRVVEKRHLEVTDNSVTMNLIRFVTLTPGTHTIQVAYDVKTYQPSDYYVSDLSNELTVTIGGSDE